MGNSHSEALLDWMRDALRQRQKEKAEYHRRAIEKLNAQYAKLQNRIDQIYLDKLDGEMEDAFYRRNVSLWREEQAQIRTRFEGHENADQDYIEQGIRLLQLTQWSQECPNPPGHVRPTDSPCVRRRPGGSASGRLARWRAPSWRAYGASRASLARFESGLKMKKAIRPEGRIAFLLPRMNRRQTPGPQSRR